MSQNCEMGGWKNGNINYSEELYYWTSFRTKCSGVNFGSPLPSTLLLLPKTSNKNTENSTLCDLDYLMDKKEHIFFSCLILRGTKCAVVLTVLPLLLRKDFFLNPISSFHLFVHPFSWTWSLQRCQLLFMVGLVLDGVFLPGPISSG